MQQNPLLTAMKILVFAIFTVVLYVVFLQYTSMEVKVVRTHDQVNVLDSTVAELRRTLTDGLDEMRAEMRAGMDEQAATAAETRDRVLQTEAYMKAVLDMGAKGMLGGGGTNGGGDTRDPRPPRVPEPDTTKPVEKKPEGPRRGVSRRADRSSKPSIIAGKKIYPYNPGYTVLCDASANEDPIADFRPVDQIDWDAVLNDYYPGEPKGLNFYSDDRSATLVQLSLYTHDAIASRKRSNVQEWKADIAERVEESPDRKTYVIYVRKGVRWHTPEPAMLSKHPWLKGERFVTARDVKFTYDLLRHDQTSTPLKVYYEGIESVEVLDDHAVRVVWKQPNFYARGSTLDLQPLAHHIFAFDPDGNAYGDPGMYAQFGKHWYGKSICGNGPYRFVEYRRGELIRCVRNESYYGARATCKEYYVNILRDNTARLNRFWAGGLVVNILSPEQYREFILEGKESQPVRRYERWDRPAPADWKYTYAIWRRPTYGGFGWNQRKPMLSDKRVRQALTHALNRWAVPEKIFYGLGEVQAIGESVLSPYFNPDVKPLAFDLEAAKRLLTEAGWVDTDGDGIRDKLIDGQKTDLEFTLLFSATAPSQSTIAQMYQEDLLKCGVKMVQDPAESALWGRRIHDRDFDGFIIFWTAGFDSDPRQLWDSAKAEDGASNNYTGFRNAEADQIFLDLEQTFDYPTRIEKMHRWYRIQADEQPYTWIWTVHSPLIVQADWRIPEPHIITPKVDRRLMWRWKKRN